MRNRRRIYTIMMAVLMLALLLAACQPTPENLVVQQKDGENLMNAINSSSQDTDEKYTAPEIWTEELTLLGGKVNAKINAGITIPNVVSYPSIRVEPDRFSYETFQAVEALFFPDCSYYSLDAPTTKEEIEQLIIMTQQSISDPNSDFNTAKLSTDDYNMLLKEKQSEIETWQKQYSDAPFAKDLPSMEVTQETFNQEQFNIKAVSKDGILKAKIIISATSDENCRRNVIRIISYPRDPSDKSNYEYRKNGDEEGLLPPLLKISAEEAIKIAEETIDSLRIEDMDYSYVSKLSNGDSEEYQVFFTKTYDGVPSNYASNGGQLDEYAFDYADEVIQINVNNDGVILFRWDSPSKEAEVLNKHVKLLEFSKIQEIARDQLEYRFSWQEGQDDITEKRVTIDDIKLGMMRVGMPNSVDQYMVIPVWDFYGSYEEVYPAEMAEELQHEANPDGEVIIQNYTGVQEGSSLFAINAIDGSIINRD